MRTPALPHSRSDAIRQILLFAAVYLLYELVRGLTGGAAPARAAANATRVIGFERSLHVFAEPSIQGWALHHRWLMDLADCTYLNAHGLVTFGVLALIYLRHHESFAFVRNTFLIAMILALVGYALFPTAPPRLMPQWGFTDAVRAFTGIDAERGPGSLLLNADAAIPSMHVCFALVTGGAMARTARRRAARVAWCLYPLLITITVVVTGNHYLLDAVLGAATAGLAALVAGRLPARARPGVRALEQATA